MDSLIVDLDKVLDDFEAEEKASSHLPGQEVKHTEFAHYVALKEDRPWEDLNQAPINNETTWKLYPSQEHKLSSTGYDDPYIPAENFDLSEADFAPSVLTNEKPYKFSNYSDINNHLQRDSYGDEFQKNLQKIDNNLSNGSVSSSELNIIPQPKAQNEECKYINVNSVHADQNGDLDRKEEIQTTNNKNEINQKHARPTNFTMYNLPSPDAKFPIQARDEFTPVYENQPFPPDLAPALQSKSSLNVSLNMIPENSLKADSMESDRSYSETSVAGSDSSETLPKMLAQNLNLQLSSQESSMNSNNSDKPQKDDDRVNSVSSFNYSDGSVADNSLSNSLAGSDFNSKSQNDNSAIHSMSNTNCIDKPVTFNSSLDSVASLQQSVFAKSTSQEECVESQSEVTMTTEPQSPRYVLNTNYCNTLEDNMVDGNQNMQMMDEEEKQNYVHNDFSSRNELDTEEQTTVAFNRCEIDSGGGDITSSSNAVASKQTVGFGDIDTDMAENDLDSYLEDVTDDTESTKPEVRNHYDSLRNGSPLQYGSLDSFKPLTSHEDTIQTQTFSLDSNVKHASLPSYDQLYSKQCDNPPSYDQLHPTTVAAISDSKSLAEGYTSSNSFNNQNPEENDCVDASSVNVSQFSLDSEMPVTLNKSMTASGGARPKESSIFSNSVKNTNAGLVKQEPLETAGTMECVEAPASKENLSSEAELLGIHVIPKETKSDSSPGEITPKSSTEEEMDEDLAAAIALSLKDAENLPVAQEVSPVLQDPQNQEVNGDLALSVSDQTPSLESSEETEQSSMQHRKRPNSLNLPPRGEGATSVERSQAPYTFPYSSSSEEEVNSADQSYTPENMVVPEVVQNTDAMQTVTDAMAPPPPYSNSTLGKVAPTWIPDSDAANCMGCVSKFTFTKRRHHCRACGKVFCSNCCSMRIRLQYMDNKEARVCHPCHEHITIADISSRTGPGPHPNNPSDYCSTIPPSQQASVAPLSPPSVMVPVGVLKRDGSQKRSEPKHVMFSDGICPGGDLTELDGSSEASSRLPIRRSGRSQKKVERDAKHQAVSKRMRASENKTIQCLIPETGLPPVVLTTENKGECTMDSNPDVEKYLQQIKDESAGPVVFAVNNNLVVLVKIISLDCCVNRICWCFSSRGMCNVGQDEIVIVLETLPNEMTIPRDIFCHLHTVYEEAGKGNTVSDMGHTIFNQSFLDSRDHGGFLYIRPTFQCLHKLILPSPPYVFGILLQKWETPWAKVFPIRLLLRLGAEYRYYPCPLISVRNRKPVFFEIGHTIMNLLADFRNYQYMLPQIRGVSIHMEDKKTCINFPRNRYEDLMKVVGNSNEHVMAVGACFSTEADSHLVCIQNDDGNYQTQAINIQNKPRKVTGASFVVFNGALKTSSGLKAKSSIVEDGLMVQITPESMAALKKSMKEMTEYTIECGSITATTVEEVVTIQWVREDKNINIGVKSPIDGMAMDGIESLHIPNATDYVGEHKVIRWTDVFFIQNLDSGSARWEPVDLSKLADTLSNATCLALTPHLDKLKEASLVKIGLRVHIEAEKVGYEVGSNEEKLPDIFMNDLDNELIPVIHSAASQNHGGSINLELVFHVLD